MTKRSAALVLILCVAIIPGSNAVSADQKQPKQILNNFATRTSLSLWTYYFAHHFKIGDTVSAIDEIMVHKSLDWGRTNFGNTGNYALEFKLDDFTQAEFRFDRFDRLQSYGLLRQRAKWIKDPDGNILYSEKISM
jgi:hypothetical protein